MAEKKKIPEIRFKGFLDEWDAKKLGDLGSVAMNKRIFKEETSDEGDVPFFKIGTFGSKPNAFISRELFNEYKSKYPFPQSGDLLISASGSIGKIVEYNGDDQYFQDSNIVWLKHDVEVENAFLKVFYSIVKWSGLEGSTIKRLYNKNILETPISLPTSKEQTKIGNYFQQLDTLITLHQDKHDKLLNVKKAMLEKMFPKKGADVPEIRFKGFSEKWEERKLGEMANFSKGLGYSKNDLIEAGTPVILYGRLYTKYQTAISKVDTFVLDNNNSIYSKGNEVIVPASGETSEDIARASAVVNSGILLGGDLNIIYPNNKINSIFLALTISNGKPQKDLWKRAQGKSVVHLRNADLKEVDIHYPSNEEQTKIGNFFKNLDTLLTLHKTELEKQKNIKKACLEKMFV